ncbi:MAG: hypothetical protein ABL933_07500 [Methyloglobulus sp.]|nr:hypothetical protein [Methyloglobulus sp.]
MSDHTSPTISPDIQAMLDCLRQAIAKDLERKRRLGHYSVQWKDNAPFIEGDDTPEYLRVEQKIP